MNLIGNEFRKYAKLKGMQARIRYQRYKFERFLRVKAHFNINFVEKLPIELKSSLLP
jgi:hypothetical protein